MAIPFGDHNSESSRETERRNNVKVRKNSSLTSEAGTQNLLHCIPISLASAQGSRISPAVYCISNSTLFNCGPTFISGSVIENKVYNGSSTSSKANLKAGCKIKVRRGIFSSNRTISSEDIHTVAVVVGQDWKKLLKNLPGVTANNLSFHQAFVDALDREDSTNMAEIALSTWKSVLPDVSTISNLCKTLFSIGHPNVVTLLKP